jgi:hypothetical protein
VQHINSRLVQRPPYGMGPGFWRWLCCGLGKVDS